MRQPRDQGDERLKGIRVATLSDLVYRGGDERSLLGLLGRVATIARRLGADALITSASDPHLVRSLKRQLYVRLGGNVHLLYRDTETPDVFSDRLEHWYLTRGDGLADEIF